MNIENLKIGTLLNLDKWHEELIDSCALAVVVEITHSTASSSDIINCYVFDDMRYVNFHMRDLRRWLKYKQVSIVE